MSDMKERWHPSVALARRIGQELGADVIVIARSERGQFCGASWGRTRERCGTLGRVMDSIFDDVLNTIALVCERAECTRTKVAASECDISTSGHTNYSCAKCGAQMIVETYK